MTEVPYYIAIASTAFLPTPFENIFPPFILNAINKGLSVIFSTIDLI